MLHKSYNNEGINRTACKTDGGRTILCPYPGESIIGARRQESPVALMDGDTTQICYLTVCSPRGRRGETWTDDQGTYIPV